MVKCGPGDQYQVKLSNLINSSNFMYAFPNKINQNKLVLVNVIHVIFPEFIFAVIYFHYFVFRTWGNGETSCLEYLSVYQYQHYLRTNLLTSVFQSNKGGQCFQ